MASAATTESTPPEWTSHAARGQRQHRVRQIEGDPRRLVDGEGHGLGGRSGQVQLELHLLARQGLHLDGLEFVRIRGVSLEIEPGDRGHTIARVVAARILKLIMLKFSLWPQLFNANEAGRSI